MLLLLFNGGAGAPATPAGFRAYPLFWLGGLHAPATTPVTPTPTPAGGGKKRRRVIRFSDFETRDELERAFRIAAQPVLHAPIPISSLPPVDDEEEETEAIFKLLMLIHDE